MWPCKVKIPIINLQKLIAMPQSNRKFVLSKDFKQPAKIEAAIQEALANEAKKRSASKNAFDKGLHHLGYHKY